MSELIIYFFSGHSVRAPLEEWISWRNENFDRQLQVWRKHTEYWMDNYDDPNRLVIAYELLTDDELGADMAIRISEFLSQNDGVNSKPLDDIPCIWHTIVKYKEHNAQNGKKAIADQHSKRGGPKYVAPYSQGQLQAMTNVLTTLLEKYRQKDDINSILVSYIDEVAKRAEGPPEDENTQVVYE